MAISKSSYAIVAHESRRTAVQIHDKTKRTLSVNSHRSERKHDMEEKKVLPYIYGKTARQRPNEE